MGQWNITIQGHGIHDNHLPEDADAMMQDFVDSLKEVGHEIESAHFTVGYAREVSPQERVK